MSKVLKVVASVAAIAAVVASAGSLAVFGTAVGASLFGVSAAALSLVSTGAALGASLLAGKPKNPRASAADRDRLFASIDPRTPRKIVFGRTAMATDIRDQEFTGANKDFLHRFFVVASHTVNSIQEIWFDDKLAWTSAGGVQGEYSGYLTVNTRLVGSAANAINISARMGDTRRYTGLAYVHLQYKLTGNSKKTDSPFAQSVPSRMTIIGEGMPCYDPRQDSTVPGGSGAHRANNQATWTYGAHARNPACQLLTWMLGWRINGLLAVGKGIPANRIDLPSFMTSANACDESVALLAGGTEPRYRSDGIFSEADEMTAVLDQFKSTMNAVLDDADGQIRLTVLANDLGAPIATFGPDDVLGEVQWTPVNDLSDRINIVRGTFTDPSANSLFQSIDYPQVSIASPDGINRIQTVDYPLVQSNTQAQRLAKQRLQRAQYTGVLTCTMQYTAWRVQKNDVVRLNFPALGFTNKLFRVVETGVRVDGTVPMMLREENAAIYAWDRNEQSVVIAAAPSTFSFTDNPIYKSIDDALLAASSAQTTADGKIDSYYQASAPTGASEGDYWTDTDDANKLYRYTSGAWTTIQDAGIPAAISAAAGAQATANGKITTYYAETAPTATAIGDLWCKPSTGFVQRWNGTAWADVATIGATAGTNLRRSNNTVLTDGDVITSVGTAAAITNQAATATSSDFAVVTGTTKPANNATVGARAGTNIYRTDGTTVMSQAEIRTAEGTAAAITNQAATATSSDFAAVTGLTKPANNATVGAVTGTNLFRTDGTTVLTQAEVRTAEGTAAAITNQGALATKSAVDLATADVLNKSLANVDATASTKLGGIQAGATVGARAGTNIYRTDGTTVLTQAEIRTAEGTAASITGQAATATSSDFSAVTGLTKPENNATVGATAGTNLRRSNATVLNDNEIITSLGTAASIAGQAATATSSDFSVVTGTTKPENNATVGATAGTNLRRSNATVLNDGDIITSLGTAANITGQGALATKSAVDLATAEVLNKSLANVDATASTKLGGIQAGATVGARAGTNLYRSDGTTVLTQAEVRTAEGTAAAITGQAATATSSDFSAVTGTTKPENNATVGATAGTNLRRSNATVLNDGDIITSLGTAANITNQGALATKSAVDLATAEVLNKSLANVDATASTKLGGIAAGATVGARAGTNLYRSDGTTVLTQAEVRTAEGTAAAITGQGALATKSAVAWATEVSGRDAFLTDGRISTGLDVSGRNQVGIVSAGGVPFTNPEILGTLNGTNIAVNPEFLDGTTTGWSLYDNSGGGKVSMAVVSDATAPNASGNILRISYNGTGTPFSNPQPGYGGAVQYIFDALGTHGSARSRPGHYSRGTTIIYSIIAKIPVGYNLEFASNAFGAEGSFLWMTSTAGTGGWQRYIGRQIIGTTGSFSSTGYLYAINGSNVAFDWDIAKYDQIDISSANRTFLGRGGLTRETGVGVFDNDAITSLGTSAAIAGQGALATKSAVDLATSEVLNKSLANVDATANTKLGGIQAGATVGATAGTNLRRSNPTVLNAGDIITSLGTAANIANQTAWATYTGRTTTDVSNRLNFLQADGTMLLGVSGGLLSQGGISWLTDANTITSNGTAAAIASQGALATRSNARLGTEVVDEGGNAIAAEFIRNDVDRTGMSTIAYPSGGSYNYEDSITGAIRIRLPGTIGTGLNTMVKFQVDIYDYNEGRTITYDIGGYVYSYALGPQWINCSAKAVGGGTNSVKPVRFCRTGSDAGDRFCLVIGDVSTAWSYPKVLVRNLMTAYSTFIVANWRSGWNVDLVTTLPAATDVAVLNPTAGDAVFGVNALETWNGAVATLPNFKTSQGTAAAIVNQGTGATANTLAQLDATAAAQLSSAVNGAAQSVARSATVEKVLNNNASVSIDAASAIFSSGGGATYTLQLKIREVGGTDVNVGSAASVFIAASEADYLQVSGTFTNTSGGTRRYQITCALTKSGAGTAIETQSQSYLRA